MKPLLIIGLLMMSVQSHAKQWQCEMLKIYVKNDTPFPCYLIKRITRGGRIASHHPYKIKPGYTVLQFEAYEDDTFTLPVPVDVELTYECGEQHHVSLRSTKDFCLYNDGGTIGASIVNAENLNAVSHKIVGSYFDLKPGCIRWTIF